ncbi:hypothetical protein OBBRIDRAFT_869829 [Obba rivulosa]|uniref:PHD-type domain-containing protein n=1 Tax=Obba rivulosa TaxID=1052685 RepID=A0A8E2DDM1_9APHY|nr:hypothetical protein OBBRIDRAFT_869829 [Obba rivulosa]
MLVVVICHMSGLRGLYGMVGRGHPQLVPPALPRLYESDTLIGSGRPDRKTQIHTLVLENRTYEYDDTRHSGSLCDIGPAANIEHSNIGTCLAVYHRRSSAMSSTRAVEDIAIDYARLKPHTPGVQDVVEISNSNPEAVANPEIMAAANDMSINPETKKMTDNMKTAGKTDMVGHSTSGLDSDSEFERTMDEIKRRRQKQKRASAKSQTSASKSADLEVECIVCSSEPRVVIQDAEEQGLVQCNLCSVWSHITCVQVQFGLPNNIQNKNTVWLCAHCDGVKVMWNDSMQSWSRQNDYAELEWYYGNKYTAKNRPKSMTFRMPIHRCAQLIEDQKESIISKVGTVLWPERLCDDAADLYGYTNAEITLALEDTINPIWEVLTKKHSHLIMQVFKADYTAKGSELKKTYAWGSSYGLSILPAKVLLELVILRTYLERPPQDDITIYGIVEDMRQNRVSEQAALAFANTMEPLAHLIVRKDYELRCNGLLAVITVDGVPFTWLQTGDRGLAGGVQKALSDAPRPKPRPQKTVPEQRTSGAQYNQSSKLDRDVHAGAINLRWGSGQDEVVDLTGQLNAPASNAMSSGLKVRRSQWHMRRQGGV